MSSITAVIKARNESARLRACIDGLRPLVDRIILVDDRSTDGTAALAASLGCTVVRGLDHGGLLDLLDYQGFREVDSGYILRLDVDERPTPGLASELRRIAENAHYDGVFITRRNQFFGQWLDHGGWLKSERMAFFRAESWDRSWDCALHSQVPVDGLCLSLPPKADMSMLHFNYVTVDQFVRRSLLGYASVEAKQLYSKGIRLGPTSVIFRFAKRIIGRSIFRRGYRDGVRGLTAIALYSLYEPFVLLHMLELSWKRGSSDAH